MCRSVCSSAATWTALNLHWAGIPSKGVIETVHRLDNSVHEKPNPLVLQSIRTKNDVFGNNKSETCRIDSRAGKASRARMQHISWAGDVLDYGNCVGFRCPRCQHRRIRNSTKLIL